MVLVVCSQIWSVEFQNCKHSPYFEVIGLLGDGTKDPPSSAFIHMLCVDELSETTLLVPATDALTSLDAGAEEPVDYHQLIRVQ
nr:hypothetical protein [Tanacetum cinerariifolium]